MSFLKKNNFNYSFKSINVQNMRNNISLTNYKNNINLNNLNNNKNLLTIDSNEKSNYKNFFNKNDNNKSKFKLYKNKNTNLISNNELKSIFNKIEKSRNSIEEEIKIGKKIIKDFDINKFDSFSHNKNINNDYNKKNIYNTIDSEMFTKKINSNNKINIKNLKKNIHISSDIKKSRNIFSHNKTNSNNNFSSKYLENYSTNLSNTLYNSNTITINKNLNRIKTYVITYDLKFFQSNKDSIINYSKETINDKIFQEKIISDEIIVLLDDIKYCSFNFFVDKDLIVIFSKTNENSKIKINKIIEESIGLLIEISYLLLNDYKFYIDKYIKNYLKKPTKNFDKIVDDENNEFVYNIKLLNESKHFLENCFESYKIINIEQKNYKLNNKNFYKIIQYLKRCRLNISNLYYIFNNLYIISKQNKLIVDKFFKNIKKFHIIDNKFNKNNYRNNCKLSDPFEIKNKRQHSLDLEAEKKIRLDKALGVLNNNKNKKNNIKFKNKLDYNGKLINSLLKYGTSKFKNQILSERIRQKIQLKNEINNFINLN